MVPSTSSAGVAALSMISSEVAVIEPVLFIRPCKLTIELIPMQARLPTPPVHSPWGSKKEVDELIVAVRVPRTVDFNVMLVADLAVTAPVKSSMFATSPLGRVPMGGVVVALRTLAWVKSTVMPPAVVIALFKLMSRPTHCGLPLEIVRLRGTEIVVAPPAGRAQTDPPLQEPTAAPEALKNLPLEVPMVTLIDLYDPAGTDIPVATAEVSDCSLVNSRVAPEKTETWLPVFGVRVMPEMGNRKLSTVTPVGGVSDSVRLSVPLFPPQFVTHRLCVPLQEDSARAAANTARSRYFLGFMQTTP